MQGQLDLVEMVNIGITILGKSNLENNTMIIERLD
jgi:hypothetical protein